MTLLSLPYYTINIACFYYILHTQNKMISNQFIKQIRPKKLIICFSGTAHISFNPHIQNFYYIPTNKCKKSSTQHELSVQSGRHLPCLLVRMVG